MEILENAGNENLENLKDLLDEKNPSLPAIGKKKIISQNSEKGKKLIASKSKKDAKLEEKKEDLGKINFSKFQEGLKDYKEKINSHSRELIYKYPLDIFKKKEDFSSSIGKNWRSKRRREIQILCNNIFASYKRKEKEELNLAINSFIKNYKEYYRINDYSIASISNSKDANEIKNISFALDMIKDIKGMNKKK